MQLDGTQQCFMGIMQPGWDSRGAANLFLDQLTEWGRRIQEYEGESLETFSDGMKTAVLACHALESIRNVVRLAAVPASGTIEWCARRCQSFLSFAESSTRMVEEWSRNPAMRTRRRWTLMVLAKAKERDAPCADVPEDCKVKGVPRLTRTVQPSLKASVATVARKVKWADCWKRLAEAKDKKVHAIDGVEDTDEMKKEFVAIGPTMMITELTQMKHGF